MDFGRRCRAGLTLRDSPPPCPETGFGCCQGIQKIIRCREKIGRDNYCARFFSSFFTFLSAFFSLAVFAGSFFADFFASLLLLIYVLQLIFRAGRRFSFGVNAPSIRATSAAAAWPRQHRLPDLPRFSTESSRALLRYWRGRYTGRYGPRQN